MRRSGKISTGGQSLIELLIGVAVAVLVATSVIGAIVLAVRTSQQSSASRDASLLAQELLDKTRSVSEGRWSDLYNLSGKGESTTYYLAGTSTLSMAIGTEEVLLNNTTYTRWFSVENVDRDSSGDIVDSGGMEDPSTQKITITVQWPFRGDTAEITVVEYFTRWGKDRVARFTDWSGSSGGGTGDCAGADGEDWDCMNVDSSFNVDAEDYAIAVDPTTGYAWVSYYDDTSNDFHVARYVGVGNGDNSCGGDDKDEWQCMEVDITGSDIGQNNDIAISPSGDVWVGYSNPQSENTHVAKYVGSGGDCSGADGPAWDCMVVHTDNAGDDISIAIDSNENPWVSWRRSGTIDLYAAKYVGSGGDCNGPSGDGAMWDCMEVDDDDAVGDDTSIDVYGSDTAWIAHRRVGSNDLYVARYVGSGGNCTGDGGDGLMWECMRVDTSPEVIGYVSLAVDSSGRPWVSYADAVTTNLLVARYEGPGGGDGSCSGSDGFTDWVCTRVDTGVGNDTDIALDSSGNPWVIYRDTNFYSNLLMARYVGDGSGDCIDSDWDCMDVDDSYLSTDNSAIAIGPSDDVWFSHRNSSQELVVAKYVLGLRIITEPDSDYYTDTGIDSSVDGEIKLSGSVSSGSMESDIFDTESESGVKINSVLWQGTSGTGGNVKFQVASSNCSNGGTDYATCTADVGWGGSKTGGDGAFMGSDGTSSTYYEPTGPDSVYTIPTEQHNNKRYFRYKVFLSTSSVSPTVQDIIINWSP